MSNSDRGGSAVRGRLLSVHEFRLWHRYTNDILRSQPKGVEFEVNAASDPARIPLARKALAKLLNTTTPDTTTPDTARNESTRKSSQAQSTEIAGFTRRSRPDPVDRRVLRKIRKRRVRIDATLDLHDLHVDEAFRRLRNFLAQQALCGNHLVLVISGKGKLDSNGYTGALHRMLPIWLGEVPLSDLIVSHALASPRDGGNGARYIFLRAPRRR